MKSKIKRGYRHTAIGEIPVDWQVKRLNDVAIFKNGKAHENNIIKNGQFIVINSKFVSSEGKIIKYTNNCLCPLSIGDIAMVMSDVPNGKAIAKCFYITANNRYTLNQRICSFKTKNVDSTFLYFVINRNHYYLMFDDGVKQTNLRKEDVLSCPLPFPPLPEQKKIAEILSTWDCAIETATQLIDAKKKLKKGLMQQLLTGKARFKEFGEPAKEDKLPEGWKEMKLGEVFLEVKRPAELQNEQQYNLVTVRRRQEGVEKRSTLKGKEILTKSQFYIKENDFLISKRQIVHGACGVVSKEFNNSIVSNEYLVLTAKKNFSITYLRYFSFSPIFQKDCYLSSIGVHIEKMVFKPEWWFKTKHYFPPFEEQQQIAAALTTADKEIEILNKKLQALKQQKKGLMQQLLTGKIRVNV